MSDVITIDIGHLFLPPTLQNRETITAISTHICDSLKSTGFFYIKNYHQRTIIDPAPHAQSLFSIPQHALSSTSLNRGYISSGSESGSLLTEHKESYAYGREPATLANNLSLQNIYPAQDPAFKTAMTASFNDMVSISRALAGVIHVPGLPSNYLSLVSKHGGEISLMRLFNYHVSETGIGSSPHTDWGILPAFNNRLFDID
jgi:isopenicillin N synthase-like dioxygenase